MKKKIPPKTSRHHKRAKVNGGKANRHNISIVPIHKHRAWHTLFETKQPYEIAEEINTRWLDPRYRFLCIKRE